jgi:hypothetical protein
VDVIPKLLRENIPSLSTYFQKRIITNDYLQEIKRGQLKRSTFPIGMMSACIWNNLDEIEKELFVPPE